MKYLALVVIALAFISASALSSTISYRDGVAIGPPPAPSSPSCTVISTVPSPVSNYSMGLAWDGQYLWVSDGFTGELYQYDFENAAIVNNCNGLDYSLRDLTWQALDSGGGYLWTGTWSQNGRVNQIDVENCAIVGGFNIPQMGANKCHGAAWHYYNDGTGWRYELILGEEGGDFYWADPSTGLIDRSCSPYSPFYDPRGMAWDGFGIWAGYQDSDEVRFTDDECNELAICTSTTLYQQGTTWDGHYLYTTGGPTNTIAKVDVGYELTINIVQQGITVAAGSQAVLQVEVRNHTPDRLSFDAWLDAYLTNGNFYGGNPLLFRSPSIPGDFMASVPVAFNVPAATPPGNYLIAASVSANNNYPDQTHVDHVRVTVTPPLGPAED